MQAFSPQGKKNQGLLQFFLLLSFCFIVVPSPVKAESGFQLLKNKEYFVSVKNALPKVKESVYLSMYLFKTGPAKPGQRNRKNRANQFLKLLIAAKKRGVKVIVRLERSNFNRSLNRSNRWTAKRLKKAGVQVIWDSPKRQSHSKLMILDQKKVYLGSHNLSHSALAKNQELSIVFEDAKKAKVLLKEYFGL